MFAFINALQINFNVGTCEIGEFRRKCANMLLSKQGGMAQSKSPPKACATSANTKFLRALHALCALHALRALRALHALLAFHALRACIALQKTGSKCVHKQKKQTGLMEEEKKEKELQCSFANCLSLRKTVKILEFFW